MNIIIDLSHPLYQGMPHYPTDPEIRLETVKNIEKNRSKVTEISLGSHTATHVDAPSHIFENGKGLESIDLSHFFGLAVKLNLNNQKEYDLEGIKYDGIILETDWGQYFDEPKRYFSNDRPSIPLSLVEHFIEKNIKFFGCDLPSVDKSGTKEKIIHQKLLSNDVVIYENLANLEKLPNGLPFMFIGFPLNIQDIDGSPVRAVAVLKDGL